ncbi:MAG: hypothetical protein IJJ14_03765, partial [Coriobacteriales bacterium]|nr:hypothetical protein [Coriobacteriales bacterium]
YNGGTIIVNGQQLDYIPSDMMGGMGGMGGQQTAPGGMGGQQTAPGGMGGAPQGGPGGWRC